MPKPTTPHDTGYVYRTHHAGCSIRVQVIMAGDCPAEVRATVEAPATVPLPAVQQLKNDLQRGAATVSEVLAIAMPLPSIIKLLHAPPRGCWAVLADGLLAAMDKHLEIKDA